MRCEILDMRLRTARLKAERLDLFLKIVHNNPAILYLTSHISRLK
jgi:hypothetical protein